MDAAGSWSSDALISPLQQPYALLDEVLDPRTVQEVGTSALEEPTTRVDDFFTLGCSHLDGIRLLPDAAAGAKQEHLGAVRLSGDAKEEVGLSGSRHSGLRHAKEDGAQWSCSSSSLRPTRSFHNACHPTMSSPCCTTNSNSCRKKLPSGIAASSACTEENLSSGSAECPTTEVQHSHCSFTTIGLALLDSIPICSDGDGSCSNGLSKRPKAPHTSKEHMTQSQVRRLGERITALQQLVSPYGKTDTASVLLEAIGYIKFLQDQVHVLSSPYMIPNSNKKGSGVALDLRSRGLCLMPMSCMLGVASSNGADYWISGISKHSR